MNIDYCFLVASIKGIGIASIRKLLSNNIDLEQVYEHYNLRQLRSLGISEKSSRLIIKERTKPKPFEFLEYLKSNNVELISLLNNNYSVNLKNTPSPPSFYFQKGNIEWNNRKVIAVVGMRKCSNEARDIIKSLFQELKDINPIIVSGLALGIDQIAHEEALNCGLDTVAVIGSGLNNIYPGSNKKLAKDILDKGGVLISEFGIDGEPLKENFPKRNRIVAGLCDCLIVIQSAYRGGSLITADMAFDFNRTLFAVPGKIGDEHYLGTHRLIKSQKAHLLDSSKDFLNEMNWESESSSSLIRKQNLSLKKECNLTGDSKLIYDCIKKNNRILMNNLGDELNMSTSKLSRVLFNLEMQGIVKCLPGKRYTLS